MTQHSPSPVWRKSSYSAGQGQCLEVAPLPSHIAVRDSKRPDLPAFHLPRTSWRQLIESVHTSRVSP